MAALEEGACGARRVLCVWARGEGAAGPFLLSLGTPTKPQREGFPLGPRALRLGMVWDTGFQPQAAVWTWRALPSSLSLSRKRRLATPPPRETGVTSTRLESDRRRGDRPGL